MSDKHEVPTPMNTVEHLLYAQVIRLDALCNMLSSIIETTGKASGVAVESNVVKDAPPKKTRIKK